MATGITAGENYWNGGRRRLAVGNTQVVAQTIRRDFLAAQGGSDWVVLHGGATAVFRVQSVVEAARLAEAIAHIPGLDGAGVLMTIADGQVTVRLTRGVFRLEERHVQLAHAVSAVAREHGAVADRTRVQEVQLAISARPDAIDIGFWRAVPEPVKGFWTPSCVVTCSVVGCARSVG
jgi:hypothetical protein